MIGIENLSRKVSKRDTQDINWSMYPKSKTYARRRCQISNYHLRIWLFYWYIFFWSSTLYFLPRRGCIGSRTIS